MPFRLVLFHDSDVVVLTPASGDVYAAWVKRLAALGWKQVQEVERQYLSSGFMWKAGVLNSKFQRRWFVLLDYALHYYRKEKDANAAGNIPLLRCSVSTQSDVLLHVVCNSGRTFIVRAETARERQLWFNAILVSVSSAVERERSRTEMPAAGAALGAAAGASAQAAAAARMSTPMAGGRGGAFGGAGPGPLLDFAARAGSMVVDGASTAAAAAGGAGGAARARLGSPLPEPAGGAAGRARSGATLVGDASAAPSPAQRAGEMSQADELRRRLASTNEQLASVTAERDAELGKSSALQERLQRLDAAHSAALEELSDVKAQLSIIKPRLAATEEENAQLMRQTLQAQASASRETLRLQEEVGSVQKELLRCKNEIETLRATNRGLEAQLHAAALDGRDMSSGVHKVTAAANPLFRHGRAGSHADVSAAASADAAALGELRREYAATKEQNVQLASSVGELQTSNDTLRVSLERVERAFELQQSQCAALRTQNEELSAERRGAQQRYESLRNMIRSVVAQHGNVDPSAADDAMVASISTALGSLSERLDEASVERDEAQKRAAALTKHAASLRGERRREESATEEATGELVQQKARAEDQLASVRSLYDSVLADRNSLRVELDQLGTVLAAASGTSQEAVRALEEDAREARRQRDELQVELAKLRQRAALTNSDAAREETARWRRVASELERTLADVEGRHEESTAALRARIAELESALSQRSARAAADAAAVQTLYDQELASSRAWKEQALLWKARFESTAGSSDVAAAPRRGRNDNDVDDTPEVARQVAILQERVQQLETDNSQLRTRVYVGESSRGGSAAVGGGPATASAAAVAAAAAAAAAPPSAGVQRQRAASSSEDEVRALEARLASANLVIERQTAQSRGTSVALRKLRKEHGESASRAERLAARVSLLEAEVRELGAANAQLRAEADALHAQHRDGAHVHSRLWMICDRVCSAADVATPSDPTLLVPTVDSSLTLLLERLESARSSALDYRREARRLQVDLAGRDELIGALRQQLAAPLGELTRDLSEVDRCAEAADARVRVAAGALQEIVRTLGDISRVMSATGNGVGS